MSNIDSRNMATRPSYPMPARTSALKIALLYAALAALWILCSGWLLHHFVNEPQRAAVLEDIKGWFFVAITALLLGLALDRYFRQIRTSGRLLRQSQDGYRLLVEASNEGIWAMDAEHRTTFVNRALADMLGLTPEELVGRKVEDFFFPEDFAPHEERMARRHLGEDEIYERRIRRKDGTPLWVLVSAKAVQDEQGRFAGSFAMMTDISERKSAEKVVAEESIRRRILIEQSRDGIVVLDENGRVYEANQRFADLLGYSMEEVGELHVWDWDDQWTREELLEQIRLSDATGNHFETRHRRKDGSFVDVELSTNGAVIEGHKLVFCVCRDISQRKQAELALRERDEQFRLFIEHSPAAIAMLDRDMRYLVASRRWLSDYHLPDESIIGRRHYDVFPEIPERWKEIHRRCLAGAVEKCEADPFPRADGSVDWVRWEIRPWRTSRGEIGGLIILSEVITDRRRADEALRQSEEEFRAMFETASIGMGQADPKTGRFVRVNQKMCAITGYSADEMLQLHVADITHPDDRELDAEQFNQVILGKAPDYHIEKRYIRKDGSIIWVNVNMTVLRDSDGQPLRTMATIEDITHRKQSEEALRDSEERFRSTLDNMLEGCQLIGFDWRYLYLNQAAADQGRRTISELAGRTMMEAYPGIEKTPMFATLQTCMADRTPREIENEFIFPDGSKGWFQLLIQPAVEGLFILSVDITERIRLEGQLRQAQKLEAIGQLAGGVAHDFNNILAAIMMHLGLLNMNGGVPEETRHALNDLESEANRAAALTRQLLMFSRRSVLNVRPLNVNEAVTNLMKMLGRLIGEHIQLRFETMEGLPLIEADLGMLEQILMNLVVNARDAISRGGEITISTSVRDFSEAEVEHKQGCRPGRFVALTVSDTGCGMDSETAKRIFEPFFTTKEAGKGTGLGLATVHGIVAQHKGWINVDSTPGRGTTFQVWLPAARSLTKDRRTAPKVTPVRRGSECILVVEDDETLRRVTARSLEGLGYRVFTAANGQDAMTLWGRHEGEIDLLLTDMVMPEGITGLELAERLQVLKPDIAVIIASGYSADMVQAGVPTREGVVYLPKPFRMKMLATTVRKCLDREE